MITRVAQAINGEKRMLWRAFELLFVGALAVAGWLARDYFDFKRDLSVRWQAEVLRDAHRDVQIQWQTTVLQRFATKLEIEVPPPPPAMPPAFQTSRDQARSASTPAGAPVQ